MGTRLVGLALALAGCVASGDELGPADADFRAATGPQRAHAIGAATSSIIDTTFLQIGDLARTREGGPCPSVTRAGIDVRLRGGCVDPQGWRWDGSVTLHNLEGRVDAAGDPDVEIDADDLTIRSTGDGPTVDVRYDGVVGIRGSRDAPVRYARFRRAFGSPDVDLRVVATWPARGPDGTSTASEGSWVAIEGVGRAEIDGAWTWDGARPIEVRGANVLRATLPPTSGCYQITIDGVADTAACEY